MKLRVLIIGLMLFCCLGCSKKKTMIDVVPDEPRPVLEKMITPEPPPEPMRVIDIVPAEQAKTPEGPLAVVYFAFDNAKLAPQEAMKLDDMLRSLMYWNAGEVEVRGYACRIGSSEYNIGLSIRRANTVATYLGRGLALGFGEEYCEAPCVAIDELECADCRKVEVWHR